jgi:DedD protein
VLKVKERLTGAIILVALIVLLVPELLTGPVRTTTRAAAVASSTEGPPLLSYTIKLGDDARARSAAPAASGPAQPSPLTANAAADPAATAAPPAPAGATTPVEPAAPAAAAPAAVAPAAVAPAAVAPAAATALPAPAAAGPGSKSAAAAPGAGWVVQLGSFASHANAEQLARKVHAQGFTVSVSQGSRGRRLYRVRVGPVADRPAAMQLAQRLRASGHSGAIVPL